MLKRFILVFAIFLWPSITAVQAQDASSTKEAQSAIRGVIESQLAAFKRDDGQTAFSFASPTIKQIFGTPERFMAMVRQGYPAVYRPQAVEFLKLHQDGTSLIQEIRFIGPDGKAVIALYSLIQTADGNWLIDGVVMVPAPEQAV